MNSPRTRKFRGFTLIEIMAVILVIGLAMSVLLPNLGATRRSKLEQGGRDIAARLQLARQRAIVTGRAHRVLLELENGSLRIDWHVSEAEAYGETEIGEESNPLDPYAGDLERSEISLSPPKENVRDYFPIPGQFGDEEWLSNDFFFLGVETPEGWIERGSVQIVFQNDGTTDYAEIFLKDEWENQIALEVQPLLDIVRLHLDEGPE